MDSSGGYELVSLSSEYRKHLSSIVLNNYNYIPNSNSSFLLFFNKIFSLNFQDHFFEPFYLLDGFINLICELCNSNSQVQCTCTCKCDPPCNENTICLCLCNSDKESNSNCYICICKKQGGGNCKCVCICICNKAGDNGCGTPHTCDKCLLKVDIGTLRNDTCTILCNLCWIRCCLSRIENQSCSPPNNSCCCTCCVNGCCNPRSCRAYCCCKDGQIDYKSIISKISIIVMLLKNNETKLVINKLLKCVEIYNKILLVIDEADRCLCVRNLSNSDENYKFHITGFYSNIYPGKLTFDVINKMIKVGNNYCLCMVIKYILYPMIYKCINYIINSHNDFIYTIDRNFNKSRILNGHNINRLNILYSSFVIIYKVCIFMERRYLWATSNIKRISDLYCFCRAPTDQYYPYLISIILFLSSLLENIWSMDTEAVRRAIEKMSSLLSEFQSLHVYTNYGSSKSNNLNVGISGLYNAVMIKGFGVKNGSKAIVYSGFSLKYKIFSFNNISGYIASFVLINKLNLNKDQLNRLYQIFSRLSFEINIKWKYTEIKINRSIYMYVSNLYIAILKEMCSNTKCQDAQKCKCPKVKIYVLSILMTFIYGKLKSKIDITEELLYIMDLLKKNKFDEYMKLMKNIADDYINHNNMTIEYIKSCLKMLKNTQLTSTTNISSNADITHLRSVINWGYDTHFEHHVTKLSSHKIIS